MDREWSTSALSAGVLGWAWFGIQLSDGRELMFYRLRQADGTANRYSSGSLIERDGTMTRLRVDDVESQPIAYWTSERTHATYPLAWRIAIPTQGLALSVQPYLEESGDRSRGPILGRSRSCLRECTRSADRRSGILGARGVLRRRVWT